MIWQENFSYDYYRKILEILSENYICSSFPEALERLSENEERPIAVIRHDVDIDMKRAMKIAEIEKEYECKATYMVMLDSPFYAIDEIIEDIKLIFSMGNDIGLHFCRQERENVMKIEREIKSDCKKLEGILHIPIRSVSIHVPLKDYLFGPTLIVGRVNCYSRELMEWYVADSKGRFTVGEPVLEINKKRGKILQLLLHPIWWGQRHALPQERIQEFFVENTANLSSEQKKKYAEAIYNHLPVCRQIWKYHF